MIVHGFPGEVLAQIDDECNPARLEHAVHLVERLQRAGEILERRAADDEIEPVAGEGQVGGVAVFEIDVHAGLARVLAGDAHEGAAGIEPDHAAAGKLGDFDRQIAGTGRDFEHAGVIADIRRDAPRRCLQLLHLV